MEETRSIEQPTVWRATTLSASWRLAAEIVRANLAGRRVVLTCARAPKPAARLELRLVLPDGRVLILLGIVLEILAEDEDEARVAVGLDEPTFRDFSEIDALAAVEQAVSADVSPPRVQVERPAPTRDPFAAAPKPVAPAPTPFAAASQPIVPISAPFGAASQSLAPVPAPFAVEHGPDPLVFVEEDPQLEFGGYSPLAKLASPPRVEPVAQAVQDAVHLVDFDADEFGPSATGYSIVRKKR